MTLNSALTILLSAMIVNNIVAHFGIGNVALGENTKSSTFLVYSCIMFGVATMFASICSFLLKTYVFDVYNLADFIILSEVLLALLPIFIIGLIIYKKSKASYFLLKDNTYLITFTAAVFGAVLFVMQSGTTLVDVCLYALGTVMGFVLVNIILYTFSGYARRNIQGFTPYLFNLLTLAIISLLFTTFSTILV